MKPMREVPLWEKSNLSLEEALSILELVSINCEFLQITRIASLSCGLEINVKLSVACLTNTLSKLILSEILWCKKQPCYDTMNVSYQGSFHHGKEFDNV